MNILKILTRNRIIGNVGEDAICKYLKDRRYKIIHRNYVEHGHEIDIIAENKEFICFVEVKTRTIGHENPKEERPAASINTAKQKALISAASTFVASSKKNKQFRFDVAEVFVTEEMTVSNICYMEAAFDKDTAYRR